MNEKRIQQVLEIEKQAQAAYEEALREAKDIPAQAEQEAQLTVEKARAEAEKQAQEILQNAQSEAESARIMSQMEEKIRRNEAVAKSNFERALAYALNRVVGKE